MAVVYLHRKLDTEEVFYIGIGISIKRSYSSKSRNVYWKNTVNKHGYTIEILYENITWEEACIIEIDLIRQYGRKDIGNGTLVNLTDGGEGNANMSEITKNKISKSLFGKLQSSETKEKRRITLTKIWENESLRELKRLQSTELNRLGIIGTKGRPSNRKGTKCTKETIDRMSKSKKEYFSKNIAWNKNTNKIEMIDIYDNIILEFNNPSDAANHVCGLSKRVIEVCVGKRKTHKGFRFRYKNE